MSDVSDTQICNLAISRLGQKVLLGNLETDAGSTASLCRLHYPICRDSTLQAHPWNFAIKRAALVVDNNATPNHEYDYAFALPTDCLRVLRTGYEANGWRSNDEATVQAWGQPNIIYRIESGANGKMLLINEATVNIEYIAKITNTAAYDPLFVDLLAQRIAAELAIPLADSARKAQIMWGAYNDKLMAARTFDGQEGSARDVVDDTAWIMARA